MSEEASSTTKKTASTNVKNRTYPLILLSLLSGSLRLGAGPSLSELHPGGVPFMMNMVETAETKESHDITNKAVRFLVTKDYAKLDELGRNVASVQRVLVNRAMQVCHCLCRACAFSHGVRYGMGSAPCSSSGLGCSRLKINQRTSCAG